MKVRGLTWTFRTASFHISNWVALQLCTNTTELRLQALGSAPGVKTLSTPVQLAQDNAASKHLPSGQFFRNKPFLSQHSCENIKPDSNCLKST